MRPTSAPVAMTYRAWSTLDQALGLWAWRQLGSSHEDHLRAHVAHEAVFARRSPSAARPRSRAGAVRGGTGRAEERCVEAARAARARGCQEAEARAAACPAMSTAYGCQQVGELGLRMWQREQAKRSRETREQLGYKKDAMGSAGITCLRLPSPLLHAPGASTSSAACLSWAESCPCRSEKLPLGDVHRRVAGVRCRGRARAARRASVRPSHLLHSGASRRRGTSIKLGGYEYLM